MLQLIEIACMEYYENGGVIILKLSRLKLYNYRCFGDVEQVIDIDNITAFS